MFLRGVVPGFVADFACTFVDQRQAICLLPAVRPPAATCRNAVGMTVGFLQSYSLLVIRTCHKRGVHAMGGMAAQIPIKNNPEVNNAAIAKVMHPPAESVHTPLRCLITSLYSIGSKQTPCAMPAFWSLCMRTPDHQLLSGFTLGRA